MKSGSGIGVVLLGIILTILILLFEGCPPSPEKENRPIGSDPTPPPEQPAAADSFQTEQDGFWTEGIDGEPVFIPEHP